MALSRVGIGGWRQEVGDLSRVGLTGWRQEQATAAATTVSVGTVTHSYTGAVPKLNRQVAAPVVTHSYTGVAPKLNAQVAAPVTTHSYTGAAPRLDSQVAAGVVTHSYTAQVPDVQVGGATTVYAGVVTHFYTAIAPKLNAQVAAPLFTHAYTAVAPKANVAVAAPVASHAYTAVAPSVLANLDIVVPVAGHSYSLLAPSISVSAVAAVTEQPAGGWIRRKRWEPPEPPDAEEVRRQRERLGILPKKVQQAVRKVTERELSTAAADQESLEQAYRALASGDLQERTERALRNELAAKGQKYRPELPSVLRSVLEDGLQRVARAEALHRQRMLDAEQEERDVNELLAIWIEM